MSYILDALRRSQAERDRGRVPGLDAQPAVAAPGQAPRRRMAALWLGLGLSIGLSAALVAMLMRREAPPPTAITGPPAASAGAAAQATAAVASAALVPAAKPLPVVVSAPAPAASATAVSLPPTTAIAPPPPAPRTESAPLTLAQLSAEQRRDWPALTLGGSVWSESAANRFVIVNGQLVHEGEAVAPGVTLERIGRKAAVVRWRELRIEVPF